MTMQTCAFFVEKGGAAKTATSCQFAHYLASLGKRVLFIDLDSQEGRASMLMKSMQTGVTAYAVLKGEVTEIEPREGITMIEGERALLTLERQPNEHKSYYANLRKFIRACGSKFDYCLIDCPPGADVRVRAALISADFVVSPLNLKQEHVLGVGPVLGMVQQIKAQANPNLVFLGLLITQFEASKAIQKHWFTVLASRYAKFLIGTKIPNRTAIQEAQQYGVYVGALPKSAAKEAAKELAQVFDVLIEKMTEAHNG